MSPRSKTLKKYTGSKNKRSTLFSRTVANISRRMRGLSTPSPSSSTKRKRLSILPVQKSLVLDAINKSVAKK